MNRRDFVKALAGIPLLGLLVKLPEAEQEATLTFVDSGLYEAAYAELRANAEEQPPYRLNVGNAGKVRREEAFTTYHSQPFTGVSITFTGEDPPLIWEYHNGQEWKRIEL